jgi:hypothetical protein
MAMWQGGTEGGATGGNVANPRARWRMRRFQKMRPSQRARQYTVNRQPKVHPTQSASEQAGSLDRTAVQKKIRTRPRRGTASTGEAYTTNA